MRYLRAFVRGRVSDRVAKALVTALAVASVLLGFLAESWAASLLDLNFWLSGPRYDAVVPLCDEPAPLAKIQQRFAIQPKTGEHDRAMNSISSRRLEHE